LVGLGPASLTCMGVVGVGIMVAHGPCDFDAVNYIVKITLLREHRTGHPPDSANAALSAKREISAR
jgi:hypothetical protein